MRKLTKKTPLQIRIEDSVTNNRFYQTVPYTKLFGQKIALKQWIIYSKDRVLKLYNPAEDETNLLAYLLRNPIEKMGNFNNKIGGALENINKKINRFIREIPYFIIIYSRDLEKNNSLEGKLTKS